MIYNFLFKKIQNSTFNKYRLLSIPWLKIDLVHRFASDNVTDDLYDNGCNAISFILEGAYRETVRFAPLFEEEYVYNHYTWDVIERRGEDVHKIELLSTEVWTLVFTSERSREWGYRLGNGLWLDHNTYRQLKNEGSLPSE